MKKRISTSNLIFMIVLVCIVIACFVCSSFFYQLALISGASMEPAYSGFELVIIDKTAQELSEGDVVAFKSKAAKGNLIKRIAAVEGDSVLISDGILYVNGERVSRYDNFAYSGIAKKETTIPEGGYFVIGDNINESRDSRYEEIGIIYNDDIIGKIIPQR